MENYKRGSEWRKWDLHIHTPHSLLNNGFGDDFDNYAKELFKKAILENVAVIGVTDYFGIWGYKELKSIQQNRLSEILSSDEIDKASKILLLPNIEFRIDVLVNGNRVNFHVIFSDSVAVEDIEENFLHELKVIYEGNPQGADEVRKLSRRTLEQIGQDLKSEHPDFSGTDIYVGMSNAFVSHKDISAILARQSTLFKGRYLLGVVADEDLSNIPWNSQGHLTRKILIQKSDFLFASNPRTILWGLGELNNPNEYICEFKTLKPCLHGSDAHCFADMFRPDNQRICWIKADPTFNGLKQIIYEPKERVKIQQNFPGNEFRKLYFSNIIADGIIINGENVKYNSVSLDLNKNLVAIIGGRGTGKSLLLDSLLKSFNTSKIIEDKDNRFSRICPDFFETVFCKADETSIKTSLSDPQGLSYLHVRQGEIKDIAQSPYELSNKIKDLLRISYDIDDCDGDLKNLEIIDKIDELKKWFKQKNESGEFCNTEDYCGKAINYYTNLISNITSENTKDAVGHYKNNQQICSQHIVHINGINDKIQEIQKFQESLNSFINSLNVYLSEEPASTLKTLDFSGIITPLTECRKMLEKRKEYLILENEKIKNELIKAGINQDISTLLEKVNEHQKNLSWFDNHKNNLNEKQKQLKEFITSRDSFISKVKINLEEEVENTNTAYRKLKEGKDGWNEEQRHLINLILDDIEISAEIVFNIDAFYDGIWNILNGTKFRDSMHIAGTAKMKQMLGVNSLEDFFSLCKGEPICSIGDTQMTIDGICEQSDFFISNTDYTLYEYIYLRRYYREYLKVIPCLKYKGKSPEKLSVGQRGTFYLCLRLATDPFGSPFVFDQPEDDLDNEFIIETLVPIFREIKKYRQVIIATHNANLVVNADAEQVIVANNNEENITYKAGSLENYDVKLDVCRILEGGKAAFMSRENKYDFK